MSFKPIVVLIVLSLSLSCEPGASRTALEAVAGDEVVVLTPLEASVRQREDRVTNAKETWIRSRTNSADPFQHAQFVNGKTGWASTPKSLYRTVDGGTTWEPSTFHPPEDTRIASFFFIDDFRGWLALAKQIYNERYGLGNSSQILVSNDGGNTWKEQVNLADETIIKEVSFADESHGLAIGARVIDQPVNHGPPYHQIIILSTEDGGAVWTDVSEKLNTASESMGISGDSGWTIHWTTPTQAFLLTGSGRVLYSSDRAKSWRSIVKLQDERPSGMVSSATYHRLIFDPEKRIRVIGGAIGDEGYWGNLVINGDDTSWTTYELRRIPIFDAVFLSENEVLACGFELRPPDDSGVLPPVGIVLQSGDRGKSWTPIYRSEATEKFISLTKVGDREFYAISDVGKFVRFSLN